ncbi:MAG: dienelactone hydrolase family protein [Rhodobiaceae bacterium]|nr:dienelactone hydrolase family protein [Rhodobiaceae bacterium]
MNEDILSIKTSDGDMETLVVSHDGDARPPVIIYMDAPGIREELYGFARRIATEGYTVLLPDMYYRLGRLRYDMSKANDSVREEMFSAMRSLNNALVMSDTSAMLEWMQQDQRIKQGPVGCIGYCMSGQYVVTAAGTYADHFAASASLYGVGIVTDAPDTPHKLASGMKGELYLGFAETDEWVPDNVIPDLRAELDAHSVPYTLDIWPGTGHGFCFPERDAYVEDAAEKVWAKVFDMYKRQLW